MKSSFFTGSLARVAMVAATAFAAACSGDNGSAPSAATTNTSGVRPAAAPFAVGLEYTAGKKVGDLVQVTITTEGSTTALSAIQGYVKFNVSALEYAGVDASKANNIAVNSSQAGQVRALVASGTSLDNAALGLVFRVKSADYATGLAFQLEEAATVNDKAFQSAATFTRASSSQIVATPSNLTMAELNALLAKAGYKASAEDVGGKAIPLSAYSGDATVYGDVNLNGTVSVSDATYLGNVSVGNITLLDPTTTRDGSLGGNVRPINNTDGITVGADDPCPPGVDCTSASPFRTTGLGTITAADVGAVTQFTQNPATPVVGQAIPKRTTSGSIVAIVGGTSADTVAGDYNTPVTVGGQQFCQDGRGNQVPLNWVTGNVYRLDGIVQIGGGCVLNIAAGVNVQGNTAVNPNALYIKRDGQIFANGTPTQPIVMSCTGAKVKGCWGGLAIAGNAPINLNETGLTAPVVAGRNPTGGEKARALEGPVPLSYGGGNADDNSGVLRFVRVEYAGFIVGLNNELNGFSMGGLGRGTTVEYVQSHGGLDDCFELFGGTLNVRYLVCTANQDDDFDWSFGWQGSAQFMIGQKDPFDGDTGFEGDNTENPGQTYNETPRTNGPAYNFTMIGKYAPAGTGNRGTNIPSSGMNIRRGNWTQIANTVLIGWPNVVDLDDNQTCTGAATDPELRNSQFGFYTNTGRPEPTTTPGFVTSGQGGPPNGPAVPCFRYLAGATAANAEDGWLKNPAVNNVDRGTGNAIVADLIRPFDYVSPDFRPVAGSSIATTAPSAPPAGCTQTAPANLNLPCIIVPTTYIGAVAPAAAVTGNNLPWYAVWTRGWQSNPNLADGNTVSGTP